MVTVNEEEANSHVAAVIGARKTVDARMIISQAKRKKFLTLLAQTGKVGDSAKAAGYTSSIFLRKLYNEDAEFRAAWDEAVQVAHDDVLEPEAIRRAVEGHEKDVYYKGEIVGTELVHSDTLLMFLMRGTRPEKYRDNIKVEGTINHKVGIAVLPLTAPSLEDWERAAIDVHDGQKLLTPAQPEPAKPVHENNRGSIVRR